MQFFDLKLFSKKFYQNVAPWLQNGATLCGYKKATHKHINNKKPPALFFF